MITTFEQYKTDYKKSAENPEVFWDEVANTFTWKKPWTKTLEWNFDEPNIKWFIDGKFNITENCIDRHLPTKANKTAFAISSTCKNSLIGVPLPQRVTVA